MTVEIVELDERTRVAGYWMLPGTRLEFGNIGQANSFVHRNGGQVVKSKRRSTKSDAPKDDGAGGSTGDSGTGKGKAKAKSD